MAMFFFIKSGCSTSKENLTGRRIWFNYSSLLFICFGFTLSNAAKNACDPRPETVSIYNNQYTIPQGFFPYFIKISRCVECLACPYFHLPAKTQLIKAIMQNDMTGNVYEYTLHNHTSCKCGPITQRKKEHYESAVKEVTVAYKNKHEKNNPAYILDCSQPQQRYKKSEDYYLPQFYSYKECLPICTTDKTVTTQLTITHGSGVDKKVQVTNDIACSYPQEAFSNGNIRPDTMFNIDSKKTFFALVLLALVFIIIIVIDLTFCCRKKGFCYSLRKCMQGEEETRKDEVQPTLV